MKKAQLLAAAGLVFLAACSDQQPPQKPKMTYPVSKKVTQTDDYFGTPVSDPYRWLEDDNSAETGEWVKSQNLLTFSYLDSIPFRKKIADRMTELWNYEKYSAPFKIGSKYYFYKNDGLQNQYVLYVQTDLDAEPEVFMDPNTMSADGTVSVSGLSDSKDGKYVAYQVSESGSDWRTIQIMETETKKVLEERLEFVKFSGISWYKNGFFYSRYPKPKEGEELTAANKNQKVFYHEVGTPQTADKLIYEDPANPNRGFGVGVSEDEKFLSLSGWEGTYGNTLLVKNLAAGGDFKELVGDFKNEQSVVHTEGDKLFIITDLNAPKKRLVTVDFAAPKPENWTDLIPQSDNVLDVSTAGGKIFAQYTEDAKSAVKQFDLTGKFERDVKLPGIGSAGGFGGEKTDTEIFFSFGSYNIPTAIYRYNIASGESKIFRQAEVKFNPDDFEVKQVFFNSKDGTKVPMFIFAKKGVKLDGQNPTILYGYGGFSVSLTPGFSPATLTWAENGGIYAVANIRGGAEYGEDWHKAGTLMNKQNVFDDFIAAAEYLQKEKYTSADRLAIRGGSNGGLLVGAVMTQRPELMKVALPAVGVMDMLRYQQFTIGRAWASDYGTSEDSKEMADYLRGYSPLHNLKAGTKYPATLVTTADHDDRVVPAHSFKFAATLQEMQAGENPVLIRIESKAGHGAGKPTAKIIAEQADIFAFTLFNMDADFGGKPVE